MTKSMMLAGSVILLLSACAETTSAPTSAPSDPLTEAISGKTLVNDRQRITAFADGRLIGKGGENMEIDIVGAWAIRDGKWCRTLSSPESFAGTECQDITLNEDGTVTIVGRNGPGTFRLE